MTKNIETFLRLDKYFQFVSGMAKTQRSQTGGPSPQHDQVGFEPKDRDI